MISELKSFLIEQTVEKPEKKEQFYQSVLETTIHFAGISASGQKLLLNKLGRKFHLPFWEHLK